ncbi:MAG: glycosyltransferase [Bacteroidales bacterium]|jgi:glycosyltransferase involved in cell wall biosynthesis|nr:glycosyltransferase [Bacteroidales bacterium]
MEMENKLHVLFLPNDFPTHISPNRTLFYKDQAKAVSLQGCQVGVIATSLVSLREIKKIKFGIRSVTEDGINILYCVFPAFPKLRIINYYLKQIINKILYKKYIAKYHMPDLVHAHVYSVGSVAGWIKKKYNIPYILTEHFTGFARKIMKPWQLKLAKKVYGESSANIAVSKEFCSLLEEEFNTPFQFVPNVVDTNFFLPGEKTRKTDEFTFITVGHLQKKKNHIMLIRAFAIYLKNRPADKLIIVGGGSEYNNLAKEIIRLNVQDNIILYGPAKREEVKKQMQLSDFFVLPSTFETFGVVLIEAMSCGLAVLSTRSGGPESIIKNNELGLLCNISVASITDSLKKIVKMKFNRETIRNYAIENYSEQQVGNKLLGIYRKILD